MTVYQKFVDKNKAYGVYNFKARKIRRNNKPIDREKAKSNLLTFRDIFYRNGINFFLLFGTLLGAVRDGNFIKHDSDTDIGILEKDREKFYGLIPELLKNGFDLIRTKEPDDLVTFMRYDEYIDVGIFREKIKDNKKYLSYQGHLVPEKYFRAFIQLPFLDNKFFVFKRYKSFLSKAYGNDWRVSRKNEPALNTGKKNLYFRIRRMLLRTSLGKRLQKKS